MSTTFYFIILNLIDNYDLSKCAQVHCGLWFFGLHQLTLSFHIHVFPDRFSPHWANGAPPPLQPLLNRRLHLLPQLLSQLHALHGPTGQLQPPDGNFIPCIVSYHIVSYHLILFHLILILSHLYVYINTISACTMYAILHYTYYTKSFPQIIVWNTVYLPREILSTKTTVSSSEKKRYWVSGIFSIQHFENDIITHSGHCKKLTNWCFQTLWKILVKTGIFPKQGWQ